MRQIAEFPDYFVSKDGRIWSNKCNRFLQGGFDKDGYKIHVLLNGQRRKTIRAHREVAKLYIPNPDNLPVVNHIDGVKTNNSPENLEWCTVSHNTKHAYKIGSLDQKGEKNNSCKYTDAEVLKVIDNYNEGSIAEYARVLGMPYTVVYSYIKKLRRA